MKKSAKQRLKEIDEEIRKELDKIPQTEEIEKTKKLLDEWDKEFNRLIRS